MRKSLLVILSALVLGLSASVPAEAISIGINDDNYLGYVYPGTPANLAAEVVFVNAIIDADEGENTGVSLGLNQDPNYIVFRSPNAFSPLPVAVIAGAGGESDYDGGTTVNTAGYFYLLVKNGQRANVWYLGGEVDEVYIPTGFGKGAGTSHYALFNPVPDGGATLMLLGGALVALGALRRKSGV